MATKAMTQTQLIRHLAESCQLSNEVARQFLETLAETALKRPRRMASSCFPASGGWSSRNARLAWEGTQPPVRSSRLQPRRW